MTTLPADWRDFVRLNPVLDQRQSTAHFLKTEDLPVYPMKGGTKIHDTTVRAIEGWYDKDTPDWRNWGAALMASPGDAWVDDDLDGKPAPGLSWTPELKAQLRRANMIRLDAFEKLGPDGPVSAPAFGRAFHDNYGHHLLHCTLETREDADNLRRLTMRKSLPFGDLMLRREVRLAAEKGDPSKKLFTLPGSVYMQPDDDKALDLIGWKNPRHDKTPKIGRTAVSTLHRCLYAWLLVIAATPHWKDGQRHETALRFAGLLAQEVKSGLFLNADQAEAIWKFVLRHLGGGDVHDFMRVFRDSVENVEKGRPVSGYKAIGELVGEDVRLALLHARGGSDPDAINEMFRRVVLVAKGETGAGVFVDISKGAHDHQEWRADPLAGYYMNHPDFPPLPGKKNDKTPIIKVVLNSTRIRRVDGIIAMPGDPYGSIYWRDGHTYTRITEAAPPPPEASIYLNKAEGMPPFDKPTDAEAAEWLRLWSRHIEPLGVELADRQRLEQSIAKKVQDPQRKFHLGIAMTGDQGIGKSTVFDVVLRSLYGPSLVSKTTGADLKEKFKFQTLGTSLFYAIEEVHFPGLDGQTRELFKNLMKNDTMPIEHKYGRKGDERNVAMPYFLTNSDNPGILIDGKPERSLAVVKGMSHEIMSGSREEWVAYLRIIADNVVEFDAALRTNARLRNAGRYYFAHLPIDESLFASIITDTDPEHLRSSLPPISQCLIDMFEEGYIRPDRRENGGWPITGAFKLSMLKIGLEERMRKYREPAGNLSEKRVASLLRGLFNADVLGEVKAHPAGPNGERLTVRMNFFKYSQPYLFALLTRNSGLDLTPPQEFDPATPDMVDEPGEEALDAAWRALQTPTGGDY